MGEVISILVALTALFGIILGQFFKVYIIIPANVLSIVFILATSGYLNDGPVWLVLKIMVLIPSITVGFVLGQTVFHIPDLLQWVRTHRTRSVPRGITPLGRENASLANGTAPD